jgi:ribosomal protein L35AE/L33A
LLAILVFILAVLAILAIGRLWPGKDGSDNGGGTTVPPIIGTEPPVVTPTVSTAPCAVISTSTTKTEPALVVPHLNNSVRWRVYTWNVVTHSCGITVNGTTAGGDLINRMEFSSSQRFLYQLIVTTENGGRNIIVNRYEPNGFPGGRTIYTANSSLTKIERIRQLDEHQRPIIDAVFSYSSSGKLIQVEIVTLSVNNGTVVSRQTLGPGAATDDVLKRYFLLYGEVAG